MNQSITITNDAVKHLKDNLKTSPAGTLGIRIGLRDAGCSGFAYTIDFTNQQNTDDYVLEQDGVKIFIADKFLKSLAGTEIDLVHQGINSVIAFNNPNVINQCGCGESVKFKE